jgi:hypothetical protein
MTKWKESNPRDSLKHQRRLFDLGIIDRLPWEDYLSAKPDYVQNEEQSSNTIWQRLKAKKPKDEFKQRAYFRVKTEVSATNLKSEKIKDGSVY